MVAFRHILAWFVCAGALLRPAAVSLASTGDPDGLERQVAASLSKVEEFNFIRDEASRMGIRVWLFGGAAAGFVNYVELDRAMHAGDSSLKPEFFRYQWQQIFPSSKDYDLVTDGTDEQIRELEAAIVRRYPYQLANGQKSAWEVRPLARRSGPKESLLNNPEFYRQNNDNFSTTLIELTTPPSGVRRILDTVSPSAERIPLIEGIARRRLTYRSSPSHFETSRYREGLNPPILSAIRAVIKALEYESEIEPEGFRALRAIVADFNPASIKPGSYVHRWIEFNAPKLFQNSADLHRTYSLLAESGLGVKLAQFGSLSQPGSLAWWANRKPLSRFSVGSGQGRTAAELGISNVAHSTKEHLAYEVMTFNRRGRPNVLESRSGVAGERAIHGDGFYVAEGDRGWRSEERSIRYRLSPQAREGSDFVRVKSSEPGQRWLKVLNEAALERIPEVVVPDALYLVRGYIQRFSEAKASAHPPRAYFVKYEDHLPAMIAALKPEKRRQAEALIVREFLLDNWHHAQDLFPKLLALEPETHVLILRVLAGKEGKDTLHDDRVPVLIDRLLKEAPTHSSFNRELYETLSESIRKYSWGLEHWIDLRHFLSESQRQGLARQLRSVVESSPDNRRGLPTRVWVLALLEEDSKPFDVAESETIALKIRGPEDRSERETIANYIRMATKAKSPQAARLFLEAFLSPSTDSAIKERFLDQVGEMVSARNDQALTDSFVAQVHQTLDSEAPDWGLVRIAFRQELMPKISPKQMMKALLGFTVDKQAMQSLGHNYYPYENVLQALGTEPFPQAQLADADQLMKGWLSRWTPMRPGHKFLDTYLSIPRREPSPWLSEIGKIMGEQIAEINRRLDEGEFWSRFEEHYGSRRPGHIPGDFSIFSEAFDLILRHEVLWSHPDSQHWVQAFASRDREYNQVLDQYVAYDDPRVDEYVTKLVSLGGPPALERLARSGGVFLRPLLTRVLMDPQWAAHPEVVIALAESLGRGASTLQTTQFENLMQLPHWAEHPVLREIATGQHRIHCREEIVRQLRGLLR